MKAPELSVCIPTYNSARFLPEAIASVTRQGLIDFEIVIVDNASDDETEAFVRSLASPLIRYSRNEINVGSRENHNICLSKATGAYIKFLCADDVLLEGMLEKQLEVLRSRPEVVLVTCDMVLTDNEMNPIGSNRFYPGLAAGSRVIDACLGSLNNYIGGPSNVMLRRSAVDGLYMDSKYRWTSDLKLWMQVLQRGSYFNIDEAGCLYRRHTEADSLINCPVDIRLTEYFCLVEEFNRWNILNCIQAMRRGGTEGRLLFNKTWWKACKSTGFRQTVMAGLDMLRMHSAARPEQ